MKFSRIALLSAAAALAVAQPHAHNHAHRHPARNGSPVEARDDVVVTETAQGPVVTVYELDGQDIPIDDVEEGLKNGKYVLIGGEDPTTYATPTPTPTSTPSAAQFFEKPKPTTSAKPTSVYVAPTTSAAPVVKPSSTYVAPAPAATSAASYSGGTGIDSDFPDDASVSCKTFPEAWGAVAADWLELEGWTGVQEVPDFVFGVSTYISDNINTALKGSGGCTPGSFCSYMCPAGYQKCQWPTAQGVSHQSVGGLYCNPDGKLELSRGQVTKKLCCKGAGGVFVKNSLTEVVSVCRTDYPGTEDETVALETQPGQTYPLTCPDAKTYYKWLDLSTSAQYYLNPAGVPASTACQWGTAGSNCGNWAPLNAGVGKDVYGITYLSIFRNAPTNPDGDLGYAVAITGSVSGECSFDGKTFYNNGVVSPTGCTVAITNDGTATFEFTPI